MPMTYVLFSTQIWTDNWVSKHWIAHWLAELGHQVYFVEPLRALLLPGRGGRLSDMIAGPRIRTVGKVRVVSFSSLPFYYRAPGAVRGLWRVALKRQFSRFSRLLKKDGYDLITFDGRSLPLISMLPLARETAYYCVDPVGLEDSSFPERFLVNSVDRVFAISDACKAALIRETGRSDVDVIPHGIDFKGARRELESAEPTPPPADLPTARPLIGYTGSIHDVYVDFEKIGRAARENPDWTFALIGPHKGSDIAQDASSRIKALMKLPNVHFLGSKPYHELKKYIATFDVCLIPYRSDLKNGWERRSPVKILHYLAMGKPVISADVPGVSAYRDVIYVYTSYAEFVSSIRASLSEAGNSEMTCARMELAASRDCDLILQRLLASSDSVA